MTDKQIIIDVCPYQGECSISGCKRNDDGCFVRQLFEERYRAENQIVDLNKMVEAKEQECEELKEQLELNTANAVVIDMAQRLHNYKQAIEKIKNIAYELTNEEYTDFIEGKQKQILQICDEVISE